MFLGMTKPNLAISMGDPAGISPEIIAATFDEICDTACAVLFGHLPTLESVLSDTQRGRLRVVTSADAPQSGVLSVVHCGPDGAPIDTPGDGAAAAQLEALSCATDWMLTGVPGALVTAPVSKGAISTILPSFSGHTEYLAERAGIAPDAVTMMFSADALAVGLVSTHIPLREVPDFVTRARLQRAFDHTVQMLTLLRPDETPRVAVAGLNPHAGEEGLLGTEERDLIGPFCEAIRVRGIAEVDGPLPADTLFRAALAGRYSGVVSMYHDQAMIPLKLAGVGNTVNVTMGLPFIRTSPDHGTAYDIARKGLSDPSGFQEALRLAVRMAGG